MQIDLIIDVVCPWCYLGKKQLDKAMSAVSTPPDLYIRPFQLAPDLPVGGIDRALYYQKKFGNSPRLEEARKHLDLAGSKLGFVFDWREGVTIANTLDAHRLIRWAQGAGVASTVADSIMKAYFTDGHYLGDIELLADIASEAGMDGELVRDLLQGDQDRAAVRAEVDQAHRMGLQGVPATILAGKALVSGAQAPEVFLQAIKEVGAGPGLDQP